MFIGVPVTNTCCLYVQLLSFFLSFKLFFLVFPVLSFNVGQPAEAGTTDNAHVPDLHHKRFLNVNVVAVVAVVAFLL